MPRALGVFREIGWRVTPYPVDYGTTPGTPPLLSFDLLNSLARLNGVAKEALGLLYYYLLGWTDSLYPGPGPGPGPKEASGESVTETPN